MGRRKKENGRVYRINLRLSKGEFENVDRLSEVMEMSKSEVIRAALRLYTDVILLQNRGQI